MGPSIELYHQTAFKCSKLITEHYSSSFTLGIKTLDKKFRAAIYAIYGFVRYADEIVDTFHEYDKKELLNSFKEDTYKALKDKISLNPVLHSFQIIVHQYQIELPLIDAFLKSMEMDLLGIEYNFDAYNKYIYGSAEVVGLMCLRVFSEGNEEIYNSLLAPARSLGAAFQKVNFLRDLKSDYFERGRIYFPGVNFKSFGKDAKKLIEEDIENDFKQAYKGIINLPGGARKGVYLAYVYYNTLFKKIKKTPPSKMLEARIRVADIYKLALLLGTHFKASVNSL